MTPGDNELAVGVEVWGRDAWAAGPDPTGLTGPVYLYRQRDKMPVRTWKRREVELAPTWELAAARPEAQPAFRDEAWEDCLVQDRWDSQIHGRWRDQMLFWYRAKVHVPEGWQGRSISLDFRRPQDFVWVYANGHFVYRYNFFRDGGPGMISVDLTPYTTPGSEVTLAIAVLAKWTGRKGLHGDVTLSAWDTVPLHDWQICGGMRGQEMEAAPLAKGDGDWTQVTLPAGPIAGAHSGQQIAWLLRRFSYQRPEHWTAPLRLTIDPPTSKAIIYLNGELIGRYRPEGPQRDFYLLDNLLRPDNLLALCLEGQGAGCSAGPMSISAYHAVRAVDVEVEFSTKA